MNEPQLVIQDFGGKLNADINGTRARLIKGGSWKKQRVVCIVPSAFTIPAKVYLSHVNLIYPPNNGVVRMLALGMEVGDAYSSALKQIMNHPDLKDWEYFLALEHDNMPPQDGVLKLIARMEAHPELAAISGAYFTKGEGGVLQAWGDPNDPIINFRPQVPKVGQLVECCGTGMGFTLYRLSMFKDTRLRQPWFVTLKGNQGVSTQDLYFWSDARKYGYRCAVDCDVPTGHYDSSTDIVW